MIISETVIKRIRSAFDINIYEVKVWVALLSKGVATAGELYELSNVPRSRSYDVLESLEKRGFVIMKLGRPVRYLAVKPSEILERVKKDIKNKADEEVKSLVEVEHSDAFKELVLLFSNGIKNIDPAQISGILRGRNNIYLNVSNLISKAKKEIIIATTATGLERKSERLLAVLKNAKIRGIKIKFAAPFNEEIFKKLSSIAEIKDINLNTRFVLVDSKDLIFLTTSEEEVHEKLELALWVNSEFFVGSFKRLFDNSWGTK